MPKTAESAFNSELAKVPRRKHPRWLDRIGVDETYMGGKEKNKHNSQKAHSGRGPVGKTPVAGAKDRETNRVSATVIQGTTQEELEGFIQDRVEPGSTVYMDDHGGYNRLWLDFGT